jgi:phosphopantothenoylcysteine decarboxylase/phosphopantothenate--cysteine ligase
MSNRYYLRNPEMAAISRGGAYAFIRPGRDPVVMAPVDVEALSQLLDDLVGPVLEAQLEEYVARELIDFLVEKQILLAGTEAEMLALVGRAPAAERPFRRLVFGLTGAIASMHMAAALLHLARQYCDQVDVILTESAQKLVRPELLEFLGLRVWCDAFTPRGEINVPHIHLATTADMVVVMPASAHTLYKLAHGTCSDLLSLTIAATAAPVVVVPAMNSAMWTNPAVARNVTRLREDGLYVVSPSGGVEVSKSEGQHHLDMVGGAGIDIGHLPTVLTSILGLHRSGAMDMDTGNPEHVD